jgi:hypothetical protein
VAVSDLRKSYGDVEAVRGVTFKVRRGEDHHDQDPQRDTAGEPTARRACSVWTPAGRRAPGASGSAGAPGVRARLRAQGTTPPPSEGSYGAPRETRTPTPHKQDKALNLPAGCPSATTRIPASLSSSRGEESDGIRPASVVKARSKHAARAPASVRWRCRGWLHGPPCAPPRRRQHGPALHQLRRTAHASAALVVGFAGGSVAGPADCRAVVTATLGWRRCTPGWLAGSCGLRHVGCMRPIKPGVGEHQVRRSTSRSHRGRGRPNRYAPRGAARASGR